MIRNALIAVTPCNDTFFYPIELAQITIQNNKFPVFMTHSFKSGKSYIVRTLSKDANRVGLKFLHEGDPLTISKIYGELPWHEVEFKDENGVIFYKESPSFEELEQYLEQYKK